MYYIYGGIHYQEEPLEVLRQTHRAFRASLLLGVIIFVQVVPSYLE